MVPGSGPPAALGGPPGLDRNDEWGELDLPGPSAPPQPEPQPEGTLNVPPSDAQSEEPAKKD